MRSNHVRLLHAPRHAPEIICKLVSQQAASQLRSSGISIRKCRINTAGQISKEVVSLNHDIVRTRTFNPVDLENILSRSVCPHPVHHLTVAFADPCVAR
jgi:hypothetical protein